MPVPKGEKARVARAAKRGFGLRGKQRKLVGVIRWAAGRKFRNVEGHLRGKPGIYSPGGLTRFLKEKSGTYHGPKRRAVKKRKRRRKTL